MQKLRFVISMLLSVVLVVAVGVAPARAATDLTLTLTASDMGLDPAVIRQVVPQIQAEIRQDGGLGASIKKDLRDHPPGGVAALDISSVPDFDGALTLTPDGAGMTITVPATEVQSSSWWSQLVALTLGALAGYGLRVLCIGWLTASGVGAATVPLICTPMQGAVTGFVSGLIAHAFAGDLATSGAWVDIIIRTIVGLVVGFAWEKWASGFAKNYLPGALKNIGQWILTKVPALQAVFGAPIAVAAEEAAELAIELEEQLAWEMRGWNVEGRPLPDMLPPPTPGRLFVRGADPSVIRVGNTYHSVESGGDGLYTRSAPSLAGLGDVPPRKIWSNPGLAELWAPQLVAVGGRYHIYFSAGAGAAHRMYVISSSAPTSGYGAHQKLSLPDDRWAIDGAPFTFDNQLWFVWSGWEGTTNVEQNLYLARMSNPTTVTGPRYRISQPRESWERVVGEPFVNEAPEPIVDPNGQLHIVYSANGSWSEQYCLGDLRLRKGGDPTYVWDWYKSNGCVLGSDAATMMSGSRALRNADGPGHHSFALPGGDARNGVPAGSRGRFLYHGVPAGMTYKWDNRVWYEGAFTWWNAIPYARQNVPGATVDTGYSLGMTEDPDGPLPAPPPVPTPAPGGVDLRVLPLGDSITFGVGGTPAGTGYRARLWDQLAAKPGALDFVGSVDSGQLPDTDHEGHPRWRISQIDQLVGDCTVRRYRPNVVTLHIGTNDMAYGDDLAAAPARLKALIEHILRLAPETTVLVATLVPSSTSVTNTRIQQYNARIPGIVDELRAEGLSVRLVSMNAVTTADLTDSLHPNNTGYRKMADAFGRAVTDALAEGLIRPPVAGDSAPCGSPPGNLPEGPRPPGWNWVGEIAAGTGPREQVRFADLNGDGRDDYLLVGDQGQVRLWLNRRSGDGFGWQYRGEVAAGAGPRTQVRFADLDGDGRDDYLVVGDQGQVQAWLNTGAGDAVSWTAAGTVAPGVGATRDQVRFADIDVDGRADYLVVGDQGQVRAWLNAYGAGGWGWSYQGEVASGVNSTRDRVRFADLDGDGRDDYLTVSDQAQIRGWLNDVGGARPWIYQGDVAGGVGATSAELVLADVNGDGRDDYLVVGEQGQVRAWLNDRYGRPDPWDWQGLIATSGVGREQVRLADLNGDGRDDYLAVGAQGQVRAWLNVRDGDRVGWDWRDEVAAGAGPREQVRFADLNGDGRDDYLLVGDQGQVRLWLNTGTGDGVAWTSAGQVAAGAGPRDRVRFADLNGDGRDDYLVLGDLGQVQGWLNTGTGNAVAWTAQGEVAAGVGAAGDTVTFADLDGDRRDDYLVIGAYGQVRAWVNNRGGPGSAWLSRGEVASGAGYPGSRVELAEINGDRRADYLVLDDQGGIRAWFNNGAAGGPAAGNPTPLPGDPSPPVPGDGTDPPLCVANRCS
ncbi:FG-GAP-like repeat-containing protein [Micromonospora sp. WMMD975]|uniref:FG-GAP-like repeat-containing protein n=1 Tax=Micromonospora sp. WMMD975 TaxID=3016087 RepID=UPI002499D06F|nr:FG-GAP-like repeat-containing protein [Micromonospora sp. WMMD975]WFE36349.1 FG-GAP-like repeat-containing protein [Micromonospora sp. WMMD975]